MNHAWFIQRNTNVTYDNVVRDLRHPEQWGRASNPAAIPSALADWGFWNQDTATPTSIGKAVLGGEISWAESVVLALAKRGGSYNGHTLKPLVVLAKVLAKLMREGGIPFVTKISIQKMFSIDSYEDITDAFCENLHVALPQPENGNYVDIWLNALTGANLLLKNGGRYELHPSSAVKYFIEFLAMHGDKISPCPEKREAPQAYMAYMEDDSKGLREILPLADREKLYSFLPNLLHSQDIPENSPRPQEALQLIYYGAPGTGKSHKVEEMLAGEEKERIFRTTFHPDSDYSSFIGAYKPAMETRTKYGLQGQPIKVDGQDLKEEVIVYKFVPQVFLKAYVKAWREMALAGEGAEAKPVFLVIEEINRGNCAQIFGDLFQLLDRTGGASDFPIRPDEDIRRHLAEALQESAEGLPSDVAGGEVLRLPPNLFIRATMNTSDQSLFPMDSAFKRRWDWKYVPIRDAGKGWFVSADGRQFDWWSFLEKINAVVDRTTGSADKQLGYFFAKLPAGETAISAETFVNKVLFYLFGDVFRDCEIADGGETGAFRMDNENRPLRFTDFFAEDDAGKVDEAAVAGFLTRLGVGEAQSAGAEEEEPPAGAESVPEAESETAG